jgi:hypothetical protein
MWPSMWVAIVNENAALTVIHSQHPGAEVHIDAIYTRSRLLTLKQVLGMDLANIQPAQYVSSL